MTGLTAAWLRVVLAWLLLGVQGTEGLPSLLGCFQASKAKFRRWAFIGVLGSNVQFLG